jgi:FkbM family methyltransferase
VIRKIKRALRDAIETRGYVVRPTSQFGVSFVHDVERIIRDRERPLMVDVGANTGQWLTAMKRTFPNARVLCYEPDARAFAQLENTAAAFASVECIPCALGHEPGRTQFFRNVGSVTSSLLRTARQDRPLPYAEKTQAFDAVEIEVRTLSDEFTRRHINHVDLLKTDCQGFDLRVLEGTAREIERGDVDLIATEALFHREYENQSWFHETMPWLLQRGYALVGIYGVMHDAGGRMLFGDALFAR